MNLHTEVLPEVAKYFSRISTSCTRSPKLQNIFAMNLQTLQAFLKLLNIFLEFLQAVQSLPRFRIFFMNLQTLKAFLKLLNIFLEFLQAVQSLPRFRIFSYEFTNPQGLPEVAKYFSRISTSCNKSPKVQNIFL